MTSRDISSAQIEHGLERIKRRRRFASRVFFAGSIAAAVITAVSHSERVGFSTGLAWLALFGWAAVRQAVAGVLAAGSVST